MFLVSFQRYGDPAFVIQTNWDGGAPFFKSILVFFSQEIIRLQPLESRYESCTIIWGGINFVKHSIAWHL